MKKLLGKIFLSVFFVLGSVAGFLIPVFSYEGAPISGTDTSQDTIIADSQNEFSGVQGQDNWFYGYYTSCDNSSTFTQMTYDTGGWWEDLRRNLRGQFFGPTEAIRVPIIARFAGG